MKNIGYNCPRAKGADHFFHTAPRISKTSKCPVHRLYCQKPGKPIAFNPVFSRTMAHHHNPFKSILSYPENKINTFQNKIRQQQQVLKLIQSVLPENLANHAQYCVITGSKLFVYTDSATWSSQLRFHHPAMLNKVIESGWKHVQLLQIKLLPSQNKTVSQKTVNLPSDQQIQCLRQEAIAQTDKRLNQSLLKLCDTLERLSNRCG